MLCVRLQRILKVHMILRVSRLQAVKKGKVLVFHWRGGYLTKEVVKEIFTVCQEEAAKKGKYAAVSVNWSQAVVFCRFLEQASEQEIIREEANEGEQDV